MSQTIDLEPLLAPITPAAPTGSNASDDESAGFLFGIRRDRRPPDGETEPASEERLRWNRVLAACREALTKRSKDLRVAAWLAEAATHVDGLHGLLAALRLIESLLDRYWDRLHPGATAEGIDAEVRVAPLEFLCASNAMLVAVQRCPLIQVGSETFDYIGHQEALQPGSSRQAFDAWKQALSSLPAPSRSAIAGTLAESIATLERMRAFCTERLPDTTVSWHPLLELLEAIHEVFAPKAGPAPGPAGPAASGEAIPSVSDGRPAGAEPGGGLRTREDAFRELRRVATFLRHHDPHSPIWYLLERAVRWSEMPLEQVLRDIVKPDALAQISEALGTKST
jgi:type VI secretion system protein ImpA